MLYLKLFQTEQEKQACEDTQEYVSYTEDTDKVSIHYEPFFCKLTLNNGEIIEIEGSGELTSAMTKAYSATTVSAKIGDLCTSIGYNAFYNYSGLTSVTIGSSVTSIGDSAFGKCSGLTSITIPDSVNSIGISAFTNCGGLTRVTIGNGVTSIGIGAFNTCSGLTSVTIGSSVTSIDNNVFVRCSSLTSITIPNSVTSIGNYVFSGCTSLSSITSLATTAPTITSYTFQNVKSNGTLYVPSGSSGYDVWMGTGNYYLGKYNWTKVEQ